MGTFRVPETPSPPTSSNTSPSPSTSKGTPKAANIGSNQYARIFRVPSASASSSPSTGQTPRIPSASTPLIENMPARREPSSSPAPDGDRKSPARSTRSSAKRPTTRIPVRHVHFASSPCSSVSSRTLSDRGEPSPGLPHEAFAVRSELKRPARLGEVSGNPPSVQILKERPGKRPRISADSPESPSFNWDDGAVWRTYTIRGEDAEDEICREIVDSTVTSDTVRTLQDRLRHPNIISLLDFAGFDDPILRNETLWQLTTAGTLNNLILSRNTSTTSPAKETTEGLPELFIWQTLVALLRAAHYLHVGGQSSLEAGPVDWQPIIHNFINPANIFFSHSKEGENESTFGACMLGNFSRSVVLPRRVDSEVENEDEGVEESESESGSEIESVVGGEDEDEYEDEVEVEAEDDDEYKFENDQDERKRAFAQVVAPGEELGYEAPELIGDVEYVPGPASDLWSIGAVMVAMMTGRTVWDIVLEADPVVRERRISPRRVRSEQWRGVDADQRIALLMGEGPRKIHLANVLPDCYGRILKVVVAGLLAPDPLDRGEAIEILKDAEAALMLCQDDTLEKEIEEIMRRYDEVAERIWKSVGRE